MKWPTWQFIPMWSGPDGRSVEGRSKIQFFGGCHKWTLLKATACRAKRRNWTEPSRSVQFSCITDTSPDMRCPATGCDRCVAGSKHFGSHNASSVLSRRPTCGVPSPVAGCCDPVAQCFWPINARVSPANLEAGHGCLFWHRRHPWPLPRRLRPSHRWRGSSPSPVKLMPHVSLL